MTTILFILSVLVLAFYVVGAISLIVENVLTDFFEFFVLHNGWLTTAIYAVNALLLFLASMLSVLTNFQMVFFSLFLLLTLAGFVFAVYAFFNQNKAV